MNEKLLATAMEQVFFTTRSIATATGSSLPAATNKLRRLRDKELIVKVTKGVWCNHRHPFFTPLGAVPYLLGGDQGYVSFLSAMNINRLIKQIPRRIQIATTGKARLVSSPIGTFEFFQLKPLMFSEGVIWAETKIPYRIATAEKALLDTLYLSTRKGSRFRSLPEVQLDKTRFDIKTFRKLLNTQVSLDPIKIAIEKGLAVITE